MMEQIEKIIQLEGLKNSVKYGGNANLKAVFGIIMRDHPELRSKKEELIVITKKILDRINNMPLDEQKAQLLKLDPNALNIKPKEIREKVLPDLPNASGRSIVMRLAPFPSGALHIGNARMIILNDEYVKKYNGTLLLVFDDTIGCTKYDLEHNRRRAKFVLPESYQLIEEGLNWLGVKYHKKFWKSDRVDLYQDYARDLINKKHAYVCTCKAQDFREKYKRLGKPCPCRSKDIEEQLERWDKMNDGSISEGGAVVRLKTGMTQKDPALRDHVIMRISDAPHPRIGTRCRIWPTLEFSWGIDDHLLEITHIIRGIDLKKEGDIEKFIWDLYGWSHCEIILYGRLKFGDEFKLSKTFHRNKIEQGEYDGWADPRTWSLQSLEKRGIRPQAVREALLNLRLSNRSIQFDRNEIYALNTPLIDPEAYRIFFVKDPVKVIVSGIPNGKYVATPLIHPSFEDRGHRTIPVTVKNNSATFYISKSDVGEQRDKAGKKIRNPAMKPGLEIRLKDLFTITISQVKKDIFANFKEFKMTNVGIRKIQWVPLTNHVIVRILQPDGVIVEGLGESNLLNLREGTIAQFERYGYVRIISLSRTEVFCYFIN